MTIKDNVNQSHDCHLCLVSAQAVPNITPLLDKTFKPEEVLLLVSKDMRARAEWLKKAIQPTGIKVSFWLIDHAWDIQHVQDRVLDLLSEMESQGKSIALNATGGTKPMSIAAYEVFRDNEHPVFYVHPQKDRVIWLSPSSAAGHDLEDRIRLEAFLGVYGTSCNQVDRDAIDSRHRELAEELVREITRWSHPLGKLNWYAQQAMKDPNLTVALEQNGWSALEQLAERFEMHNLLRLAKDKIIFPDEPSRFFVNGGWFEEYIYGVLYNLRKDVDVIHDWGRNIKVTRSKGKSTVKNEIDVAFLADNRLYIIECKTRNMKKAEEAGVEAIYKLDTLKEMLGGLQAKAMLVSYKELDSGTRSRAKDLGIECCAGKQVQQLRQKLKKWI